MGVVGALYVKILSFDAIARANNISPTMIAGYMVSVYWYLLVGILIRIYAVIAFIFLGRGQGCKSISLFCLWHKL